MKILDASMPRRFTRCATVIPRRFMPELYKFIHSQDRKTQLPSIKRIAIEQEEALSVESDRRGKLCSNHDMFRVGGLSTGWQTGQYSSLRCRPIRRCKLR